MKRHYSLSRSLVVARHAICARAIWLRSRVRSDASHTCRGADQERREIDRQRNPADRGRPEDIHQHRKAGRQCHRHIQPRAPDGDGAAKPLSAVSFRSTYWMELNHAANTYGNSGQWTIAVNTGAGASIGYQQASIPHIGQINGYRNLSQLGQQQIAARGATADLNDAVTTSNMQTLGTIRANSVQRQTDINALMKCDTVSRPVPAHGDGNIAANQPGAHPAPSATAGGQSDQPGEHLAANRWAKDAAGQPEVTLSAGNGYQQNFNAATPQQTSAGTKWAFHY